MESSSTTIERQDILLEPEIATANYQQELKMTVEKCAEELEIPLEVTRSTYAIIGRLEKVDELYDLEWATEAREVLLVALVDVGKAADKAMGVHTNPAAVFGAGGTHDGGKAVVAEHDPGILIRSHHGGFTHADYLAIKQHVIYSGDMARDEGMPLVKVELFPGGPIEYVDIAKVDQASHDKQKKGAYGFGPNLGWAERRVRDYVTIADQALAMLLRDNDYNKHMSLEERWAWIEGTPEEEGAVAHVFNDYWYPPQVISAVIDSLKQSELIQTRLALKYHVPASAGYLALTAA